MAKKYLITLTDEEVLKLQEYIRWKKDYYSLDDNIRITETGTVKYLFQQGLSLFKCKYDYKDA